MQSKAGDSLISDWASDRLIAAHDGDVALLYVYMLRTGCTDTEQAARALCRTLSEMDSAEEKLRRMELIPIAARPLADRPAPAEELPEYKAEDLARRSKEDPGFAVIVSEAQKVLGHLLSSTDLKQLFGIYDYLALPPEVILELLNHCVDISRGRRPSMRFIEKEAYIWVNREICTLEQAEEYIKQSKLRAEDTSRVSAAMGIHGRALSATEMKYIASWLEMGFTEEAIIVAYDRTVSNTGSLRWSYMNKILQSWHDKSIHTPAEILEKDGRRKTPAPSADKAAKPIDMDALRSMMDKM